MNSSTLVDELLALEVWSLPTMGGPGQTWKLERKQPGRQFTLMNYGQNRDEAIRCRVRPDNQALVDLLLDLDRLRVPAFRCWLPAEDAGGGGIEVVREGGNTKLTWHGFPPADWTELLDWHSRVFDVFASLQDRSDMLSTPAGENSEA